MTMNKPSRPTRPPRRLSSALAGVTAAALLCASLAPALPVQAQSTNARFRGEPVTLNFVNADIEGVTRAMAAIARVTPSISALTKLSVTGSPRKRVLVDWACASNAGLSVAQRKTVATRLPRVEAIEAGRRCGGRTRCACLVMVIRSK